MITKEQARRLAKNTSRGIYDLENIDALAGRFRPSVKGLAWKAKERPV